MVKRQMILGCIRIAKGTEDDPILIESAMAFNELRNNINNNSIITGNIYYRLAADIDISNTTNWEPIGTEKILLPDILMETDTQ